MSSYVPAGRAGGAEWAVGALWPVDAVVATEVVESAHRAAAVAGGPAAGGSGGPGPGAASGAAARALHAVVREHRAAQPDLPLRWAGHVHTGGEGGSVGRGGRAGRRCGRRWPGDPEAKRFPGAADRVFALG